MKRIISILTLLTIFSVCIRIKAQDTLRFTLPEVIRLAQKNSPDAVSARHSFRAAYWNWRTFKATLLPSLTFASDPELNRSIMSVPSATGNDKFASRDQMKIDAGLIINQNIPFTGGNLFVKSEAQRLDVFSNDTSSHRTTPILIGYQQNLFGYNQFKWNQKIEPTRYTEAKKSLIETLELVAARATNHFFNLATAQTNSEIAAYNHANADTLYQFAQGRYNIGTITENEMLQLEINLLTEQTNVMNSRIEVDDYVQVLRSYLGINDAVHLVVETDGHIPNFIVSEEQALSFAHVYNPASETLKRLKLESERDVAIAKSQRGFKADLYIQFGLTQMAEKLPDAYRNPLNQQLISLGVRVPILDWGVGKGRVKVAMSNRDKVYTEVEQQRVNFDLYVIKLVKQFNLQSNKVLIAEKTDKTAKRRNEVSHRLYLLGQSNILDLNASIAEKDRARRAYISELYNYWNLYYALRSFTGYDFERGEQLMEDYQQLTN